MIRFKIVFFSNQNGIRDKKAGTTNPKKQVFKDKLERVVQQVHCILVMVLSSGTNH
jgi:hypothetical protein